MKKLGILITLGMMAVWGCFSNVNKTEAACSLLLVVSTESGQTEEISACQGASTDGKVTSLLEAGKLTVKLSDYDGKMPVFALRGSGVQYERLVLELEGKNRVVADTDVVNNDFDMSLMEPDEYIGSGSLAIYASEEAKAADAVVVGETTGDSSGESMPEDGAIEDVPDKVDEAEDEVVVDETKTGLTVFEVVSIVYMVISAVVIAVLGIKCYSMMKSMKAEREKLGNTDIN